MPRTIDEGFSHFLTQLTPTTTESQAATDHRASIGDCLTRNFGLERFFRIGSFGNGTSISGYSDVDYLACLPTSQLTSNSTYSLTKIRDALATRFPHTNVGVSCPAIVVPFGTSESEKNEIVPAFFRREDNGYKIYGIADCAGGWMNASPDAHNYYVRTVDEPLGGKVKPLIRFIKAWKYYCNAPISSFYLELRVAKYASEETAIIYDIDIRDFLKSLEQCDLADMQDPMGVSGLIKACQGDPQRKDALSKLNRAYSRAEKACEASRMSNIAEAFRWWRLLYNDNFPTYYY